MFGSCHLLIKGREKKDTLKKLVSDMIAMLKEVKKIHEK